ncbi:MAG TPA: CPBP family intramembrane glutamic endopeptidase [Candidatus Eisenbacteria bacterium]|nr:CPBP family intramembrane glutamic endopeptidase [Candidatus Eisenbacteria bacterium]
MLATLGAFSPAVSALLLTWRAEGRDGVRRLVDPVFRGSLKPGWYAFAILFLISVKLLAALVVRLWTGAWPAFQTEALFLIPFAIVFSAPIQAGEEIGWRGYALPRLASRIGLRGASVVLGLLWAAWHVPLFFARGADTYQHSFWVYMLTVVGLSVAMAWLYARTGSLWIVMVMHAAVNNTKDIVPSATSVGQGVFGWSASPMSWATVGILSIATLALLARMPKRLAVERSGPEPRPLVTPSR